jgi:hypothetical protein
MAPVALTGCPDDFQKASRDLVAAYLNASWGMNYSCITDELAQILICFGLWGLEVQNFDGDSSEFHFTRKPLYPSRLTSLLQSRYGVPSSAILG